MEWNGANKKETKPNDIEVGSWEMNEEIEKKEKKNETKKKEKWRKK